MTTYIAEIIFFASIAYIAYLIIIKLPVTDITALEGNEKKGRRIEYDLLHALDKQALSLVGKTLRRVRLFILKIDNAVVHRLESVKRKAHDHEEGSQNILREISEKAESQKAEQDKKK